VCLTAYAGESEDFMRTPLEELTKQIAAGALHVQVGKTFHLDEIVQAHRAMEENKAGGKIVVPAARRQRWRCIPYFQRDKARAARCDCYPQSAQLAPHRRHESKTLSVNGSRNEGDCSAELVSVTET